MYRLITIPFSHYNEKARWALDLYEVRYREERYMPMFHIPAVFAATMGSGSAQSDKVSSQWSTPVLVRPNAAPICDSQAIVTYVANTYGRATTEPLYPNAEAAELEKRFHDNLGPHTRRFAYYYLLPDTALLSELAKINVSKTQAATFAALSPVIARLIGKGLHVTKDRAERSLEAVRSEFRWVDARLKEGPFLAAEHFTAADLAFACMAAPLLLPTRDDGYGATLPTLEQCSGELASVVREMRATEAGAFALRMFHEHRGHRASPRPGRA